MTPPRPIRITIDYAEGIHVVMTPEEFWEKLAALFAAAPDPPKPCEACNSTGLLLGGYCACKMGKDLARVSNRLKF